MKKIDILIHRLKQLFPYILFIFIYLSIITILLWNY
mgnify:CR=1 FL=1